MVHRVPYTLWRGEVQPFRCTRRRRSHHRRRRAVQHTFPDPLTPLFGYGTRISIACTICSTHVVLGVAAFSAMSTSLPAVGYARLQQRVTRYHHPCRDSRRDAMVPITQSHFQLNDDSPLWRAKQILTAAGTLSSLSIETYTSVVSTAAFAPPLVTPHPYPIRGRESMAWLRMRGEGEPSRRHRQSRGHLPRCFERLTKFDQRNGKGCAKFAQNPPPGGYLSASEYGGLIVEQRNVATRDVKCLASEVSLLNPSRSSGPTPSVVCVEISELRSHDWSRRHSSAVRTRFTIPTGMSPGPRCDAERKSRWRVGTFPRPRRHSGWLVYEGSTPLA